jgi:nucleoside-triphosphatase
VHRSFRGHGFEFDVMTPRILLTGRPGSGKTTLIKRLVNDLTLPAGGFYTEEIRERGRRLGFKLVTLDGNEAIFAHVNFKTSERLGKYGLDLSALEVTGVEAIRAALYARKLVIIDEIGPMEIRSVIFRDAVNDAFESGAPILATIVARSLPFTDAIKKRPDVSLFQVRLDNRQRLFEDILDRFKT